MYSFSDKIFVIDTCFILFQYSWLIRDVKDSVQNILKKLQEYMIRQSRTSSEAAAFKYESRFELRITQLISSLYWPLYFFRFVCLNWLDSLWKVPRLFLKNLLPVTAVCSWPIFWFAAWPCISSTKQRSLKAPEFMKFPLHWFWMKWSTSHAPAFWGSLKTRFHWEVCCAHPDQ